MYIPETFAASLGLMLLSMLCWGSWANAFSMARGQYRFELFYWDYAVGVMLGMLVLAAVLGPASAVFHGSMDPGKATWGLASGVVFSIGTVLLVAAISLAGTAPGLPRPAPPRRRAPARVCRRASAPAGLVMSMVSC